MLTFGNEKVSDHLLNFCYHAKRAGIAHLVGAVDRATFAALSAREIPVYLTPLARERYTLDGSNSHSSSSWKKFASMRTGEVARVVNRGYDVLHSDTDIVWLRDPTGYLMCTEPSRSREFKDGALFPCEPLQAADVAVSSDNMGPGRAVKGGAAYHAAGTFNSGILLFRATPRGRAFVNAWHRNVASPARGSRFARLTSDQQVFNNMVRKERQWPGVAGRRDSWLMHSMHSDWQGNLTLGALPLPLFSNGHGYFVQSAHRSLRVSPFAVHATYTLDWHDGISKRQRFRENGLWAVEPPPPPTERFLALNASVPPAVTAAIAQFTKSHESGYNIGVHRMALTAYLAELRDALALAHALGRTLVLPRRLCYCDKLWAGSDDILSMKCMYPGSQDHPFLPFVCPMDHWLSPHSWNGAIRYRDQAFVDTLLASGESSGALPLVRDVRVIDREAWQPRPDAMPAGVWTAQEAARQLNKGDALVIRVDGSLDSSHAPLTVKLSTDVSASAEWQRFGETSRQHAALHAVEGRDQATLIYTSGTTGLPKGVMLSHFNYLFDATSTANAIFSALPMSNRRFLCFLPLFHVNAQVVSTLCSLVCGGELILQPRFSPTTFLDAVTTLRPTTFSGVPTIFATLNEVHKTLFDAERHDLSSLEVCVVGAAPMPLEVFERFESLYGCRLVEGYGLSEGTCVSSVNPLRERRVGSIGLPLAGQQMIAFDLDALERGDLVECAEGAVGELAVRGPNVMQGYHRNAAASAAVLKQDGWMLTGDLAYCDADGFWFVEGRSKEMIIRGGQNIYPKEIEEILYANAHVTMAAVLGLPDAHYGEEVAAYVLLAPEADADAVVRELEALCGREIAPYKRPKQIRQVTALPTTATGKIQKLKVRTAVVEALKAEGAEPDFLVAMTEAERAEQKRRLLT